MLPTSLALNDFELAILRHLAINLPALGDVIPRLRIISRQFTGCGSYTKFERLDVVVGSAPISLSKAIDMPEIAYGMAGILFFKEGRPDFLEIVTIGDGLWDVRYDGFFIPV